VVIEEETSPSTWSSSSDSTSTSDSSEQVSKDVISQEKYGLYYDEVSGETQTQIDEIYQRQPFADGLVVTEVLTREEIARQVYGLDVKRNDAFEFTSIDIELQQEIEATFDAQFESETGDRIESWDGFGPGTVREQLRLSQRDAKQTIRSATRSSSTPEVGPLTASLWEHSGGRTVGGYFCPSGNCAR